MLRWSEPDAPLPLRPIRHPGKPRPHLPAAEAPPWHDSGPQDEPFNFSAAVARLCSDIVQRSEPLQHVDVTRILFAVTQARSGRVRGLQARVTPLRFRNGSLTRLRRGVTYQVQRYLLDGHEFLYLMTFCLPRFLDQNFDEKMITLFHELYHLSPAFDGDLRRHQGRYEVHSHSQRDYDEKMAGLAREYLASRPEADLHAFLRLDFAQLQRRHGSVLGIVVPRPKVFPVGAQASLPSAAQGSEGPSTV
jgi:hypothetical protein